MKRLLLAAALALAACVPDHGFLDNSHGDPARPMVLPWQVVWEDPDDAPIVSETTSLWQSWAEEPDGVPRDWFFAERTDPPLPAQLGQLYVYRAGLPEGVFAEAVLDENRQGETRWCDVALSHDWTWVSHEQRVIWLAHEYGHCLGLADDPRDLDESIMASPTQLWGVLTLLDWERLTTP